MGSSQSDELIAQRYFQGEIGNSPLINKLAISSQDKLDMAEAYFIEKVLARGLSSQAKILSPIGLKQMHKELFFEIYDWAGCFRDYTTGRGFPFCRPEFIDKLVEKLYLDLNQKLTPHLNKADFIKISAHFIGELNSIHPFIDGNGRTQRQTLSLIAEKAGFNINIQSINREEWYKSAEQCHMSYDFSGFEHIIEQLTLEIK